MYRFILFGLFWSTSLWAQKTENPIVLDQSQDESKIKPFNLNTDVVDNKNTSGPLSISPNDITWEFSDTHNYVDLIIRKKTKIQSVMLTNMYYGQKHIENYGSKVYGLRSREFNKVNGDEIRIVRNKTIGRQKDFHFLVDSTPEKHPHYQTAFRIRLPFMVEYGYKAPGENYGMISIRKGITLNLRTYAKKHANHNGKFKNNPVYINFSRHDYLDNVRPSVSKLNLYQERNFYVLKVRYISSINYVKYFLIRDVYEGKYFKKIPFTTTTQKKHKSAVILRTFHKKEGGISIIALIFLEKKGVEKDYDISAIDQKNRVARNYVSYTIEQLKELDLDPEHSLKDILPIHEYDESHFRE